MFAIAGKWLLGFGVRKILGGVIVAALAGVALFLWTDYQNAKAALVVAHERAEEAHNAYLEAETAWKVEKHQLQENLAAARRVAKTRTEEADTLKDQMTQLDKVEVKKDPACPVPPVILDAITLIGATHESNPD